MCFYNDILQWNFFFKDSDHFWHRKLTLKVRILQFLNTFTQLTDRLKNFLMGWLLVLGLKERLLECATVCVKSEVILIHKLNNSTLHHMIPERSILVNLTFLHSLEILRSSSALLSLTLYGTPFIIIGTQSASILYHWVYCHVSPFAILILCF